MRGTNFSIYNSKEK